MNRPLPTADRAHPRSARVRTTGHVAWAAAPERALATAARSAPSPSGLQACACGGQCPRCNASTFRLSQPGEPNEKEAARVAEQVTRSPAPAGAAANISPPSAPSPRRLLSGLGDGQTLDAATRAFFEPRFGADLGAVRVHHDHRASAVARRFGASAFALGQDIVVDERHYQPGQPGGRSLLAHELVHTLQQRGAGASTLVQGRQPPGTIQRSAVAHFIEAGFDEKAQVKRDEFEKTLPYPSKLVNRLGIRERRMRKFNEQLDLLNPQHVENIKAGLAARFEGRPLARKLKALQRRQDRALRSIDTLPAFGRILQISASYHYVASQTLPDGEVYRFTPGVLEAVKKKFRSGQVWSEGLTWSGAPVGVRFDIRFVQENSVAAVARITGRDIGRSPMMGERLRPVQNRTATDDFTQEPPVLAAESGDTLGEAFHSAIAIDTEGVRKEKRRLRYYYRESHRAEGRAPRDETRSPSANVLDNYLASVIAHEIGHNIGMIHDDKGIMADQLSKTTHVREQVTEQGSSGLTQDVINHIRIAYPDNPVTERNIQALLDRIPGMTQQEMGFWQDQIDNGGFAEEPSPDAGITVLRGANAGGSK